MGVEGGVIFQLSFNVKTYIAGAVLLSPVFLILSANDKSSSVPRDVRYTNRENFAIG